MKRMAALSLLLLVSARAHAGDGVAASFPAGSGSRFAFSSPYGNGELVVAVVASSEARVVVECAFALGTRELTEQFVIDTNTTPPTVVAGYLLVAGARAPERIPPELLGGADTFTLGDFLIASRAELERFRVADERIVVPASASPILATRYDRARDGQTISFWLADEARPIGIVKLASRGARAANSYTLELKALLKNVGRKIDPAKAVPMKAENRALFESIPR